MKNLLKFLVLFLVFSGTSCRSVRKMKRNKFSNHIVSPHYFMSETVASSIEMALGTCQESFKWDRWNCPRVQFLNKITSNYIDREQAFVKALTTAGYIYTFTKNCSEGSSQKCGCDLNAVDLQNERLDAEFVWSGCSDSVEMGEQMANEIFNFKNQSGMDANSYANWHNSRAGILSVKNSLKKLCRCHGLSGSCSLKSCWKSMNSFQNITQEIRKMYDNSVALRIDNSGNLDIKNIREDQLVHVVDSPDYCKPHAIPGWKGMVNRQCSRPKTSTVSVHERRSCKNLCKSCGLRVRKQTKLQLTRCNCKFSWCCDVSCDYCTQSVDEYFCE